MTLYRFPIERAPAPAIAMLIDPAGSLARMAVVMTSPWRRYARKPGWAVRP